MNNKVVKIVCWALAAACLFGVGLGIGYVRDSKKDTVEKKADTSVSEDIVVSVSTSKKTVDPQPTVEPVTVIEVPEETVAPVRKSSGKNSSSQATAAPVSTPVPTAAPTAEPTAAPTPTPTAVPTAAPTASALNPNSPTFWSDLGDQALEKGIEIIGGIIGGL